MFFKRPEPGSVKAGSEALPSMLLCVRCYMLTPDDRCHSCGRKTVDLSTMEAEEQIAIAEAPRAWPPTS
eukprot:g6557.t1